ncbi:MAG: branched chain amino acid aminotransferase [Myxococcales bacterium]
MVDKTDFIWMDGELVPWDQANVHILTHTLHYGLGAFEGIRAYEQVDGRSAVFRLTEHIQRLFNSAKLLGIEVPFSRDTIEAACIKVLQVNRMRAGYLRPLVYVGMGAMGLFAIDNPIKVAIVAWPWGAYLGEEGLRKGIRARVSSFTRHHVNSMMSKGKVPGHYVNSVLAKREAMRDGYQEAIMLDTQGFVSECSGENIFVVHRGRVQTPEYGSSILGGITRDTVMTLAKDAGHEIREHKFPRDVMYLADEVFMTGTAAEITPVREIDNRTIGNGVPGPVTMALQERFFRLVRGNDERSREWCATYTL